MKRKYYIIILLSLQLVFFSYSLPNNAQVTIGSSDVPMSGALLQIKENETINGANANKGLGMPRVKLTSKTNLYPMFETTAGSGISNSYYNDATKKADEDTKHIGLMVYNTDQCIFEGAGLYVWSGNKWDKIGNQSPAILSLSTTTLDFPSGQDLRGPVMAKTFDVSWAPSGVGITAPTWALGTGTLVPNMIPVSGSLSTTSPQTMTVQPVSIPTTTVKANPFTSLSQTITFNSGSPCNLTQTLTINQTNKALRVNGSAASSQILHTTSTTNRSIAITSNAQWKMNMTTSSAVTNLNPAIGIVNGTELSNNTSVGSTQKYDIMVGAANTRYTILTFADNEIPKRFNDVNVTIVQCSGTNDPTMQQWADQLGTAQDVTAPNGVAWHKDHEGNIFFSMNYDATNPTDNNNRWMITNLATKTYGPRTGGETWTPPTLTNTYAANASPYTTAYWGYPGGSSAADASKYTVRQRLGLLYNYAAANGNQNPSTSKQGGIKHAAVQGICPQGWHLPTDLEWTELENEIIKHTATYSSTADITSPLLNNTSTGYRGTLHGNAIKDACEPVVGNGISNSPIGGGFSILLAGFASTGTSRNFGSNGYSWSSSSDSNLTVWCRGVGNNQSGVNRGYEMRDSFLSVRCKKDN